ncbi:bacteriohemerythrin [Defluviitalea saccharophila]|uniref:Bacteriohemerythrin n=1 Tax=Defluviitalea saccharophila TaxID=879970 RepID=A0ABZ2Y421_9FIRM|nr:hemerythrin family protein [Candidatus Epulonipiscium sp.]
MSFEWKDRYSLNIPEIDEQHQKLFEIGYRAYELAMINDGSDYYDEIMAIIDELLDYVEYHFEFEERLMERNLYSKFGTHCKEHNFYISKIKNMAHEEKIDDNQQEALLNILNFLSDWISNHILITDRQYVNEFKEKGLI